MNDNHPPETGRELGPLSEGQEMRLRIAARNLQEFQQSNLGTAAPAVAVQTAQRLAATVSDLMSLVHDLTQRLGREETAQPTEAPARDSARGRSRTQHD